MNEKKLIDELEKDHREIIKIFNDIVQVGISSVEGQKKLVEVKKILLSHLQKEDKYLYPELLKAGENDQVLKSTLDTFAADMEDITKHALSFFDKYESGGKGIEFAKDFGVLFSKLSIRIRREEAVLYELYKKLHI